MAVEPTDISTEEYNKRVASWTTAIGMKIRAALKSFTHAGKGDLVKSLRGKNDKRFGKIDRIAFHFARHGVFLHKGVGRGYKMVGGTVVRASTPGSFITRNTEGKITSKILKAGPVGIFENSKVLRKPADWFNPIVQDNIDKLAGVVSEMRADQVVNATKIFIK